MRAFGQLLTGNPIMIIRCGPDACARGDRYDYAVVMEVLGQAAIIHALVAKEPPAGRFGQAYAAPILDIARQFGKPDWDMRSRKEF